MVFNTTTILWLCLGIVIAWLGGVTFFLWKLKHHYDALIIGSNRKQLTDVLDDIVRKSAAINSQLVTDRSELETLKKESALYIQKIGIVRFNPFHDTGGSQSFTVALLDHENTGITMTSLYGRTGNRWYIKEIRKGTGCGLALSKEEEEAISQAKTG